jgi:hypothetical protein
MNTYPPASAPDDSLRDIRRQVAHELYGKLALVSAAIWTLGTLILFIIFAAPAAKPIPMAMMSMTAPLLPAALPWLLYRPLTTYLATRRARATVLSG